MADSKYDKAARLGKDAFKRMTDKSASSEKRQQACNEHKAATAAQRRLMGK